MGSSGLAGVARTGKHTPNRTRRCSGGRTSATLLQQGHRARSATRCTEPFDEKSAADSQWIVPKPRPEHVFSGESEDSAPTESGGNVGVNIGVRNLLPGAGYLIAYVALDALSYVQPMLKLGITPWNPDAGLTLAFLLVCGWRKMLWTAAAAFMAEILVHDSGAPLPALGCASVVIAIGYGALAWALSRLHLDLSLSSARTALQFSACVVVTACVVASGYAATFAVAGALPTSAVASAIGRNWVGDLNGIFTLTPLLLPDFGISARWRALRIHRVLMGSQAVVLSALTWIVFEVRPFGDLPLIYILFAPVIWITLTWGVMGASAAGLLIQIGLMFGAKNVLEAGALIEIQYFLVALSLTALILGAAVAERARALQRLASKEAEQRTLLATAPDAVLATNISGQITSANDASVVLFGAPSDVILGSGLQRWLPGLALSDREERRRVSGARASGERFSAEVASVRLTPPAPEGYLLIARDTSEQDQAQIQLRDRDAALSRAMRFALAGELATALTHELNQPITALVSYLKAAEILVGPSEMHDSRFIETLHKAQSEALRASGVLKRLREFYRGGAAEITPIDIGVLVRESLSTFADRATRMGVDLQLDIAGTQEINIDKIQMQMVLHNLLANALDAVADTDAASRRIEVVVTNTDLRLQVVVADSGHGVPSEILASLFEPFVTSKLDGMGLGLAISRSLMRGQGGELRLLSSTPAGTRFMLELPIRPSTRCAG